MSTSMNSMASVATSNNPSDVLAMVFDEAIHGQSLVLTRSKSDQQCENVEEPQEEDDVGKRVTGVTTLPLSAINDIQEQLSQAQIITKIVSNVFHSKQDDAHIVLESSDAVFFHVNFDIVNDLSNNAFRSTLQGNTAHALVVDEPSVTLNIILHAVYNWPLVQPPILIALLDAVDRMPCYGLSIQQIIQPTTHIFSLVSSMAVHHPMEIYTLAAHHFLHPLAVLASSHLISCDLNVLTDLTIDRMGARYLKRLAELQMSRTSALQNIVGTFPVIEHAECAKDIEKAWALAALDVMRDGMPDYSPVRMTATMTVYAPNVKCERCQRAFLLFISGAVAQWVVVPATIQ